MSGKAFGTPAASALAFGKDITTKIHGKVKCKRTLGNVILPDGTNVNHTLVKQGWCWHYPKYAPGDAVLEWLEMEAREGRRTAGPLVVTLSAFAFAQEIFRVACAIRGLVATVALLLRESDGAAILQKLSLMITRVLSIVVLMCAVAFPGWAANFPLQILLPIASGTTPDVGHTVISSDHRIFWAYPKIEYNIRAAVVGGTFPYTFTLSGQPSGMTINSTTGEISWPNPTASTGNITLTVSDSEHTAVQSTWVITVDANKFLFVDCDAGNEGAGAMDNPFHAVADVRAPVSLNKIVYFRRCSGNYNLRGITPTRGAGYSHRIEFNAASHSQQWLAYPGEAPTLDLGPQEGGVATTIINATTDEITVRSNTDVWRTGDWVYVTSTPEDLQGAGGRLPHHSGGPLTRNTEYFVIRVDATHVKLSSSLANANAGIALDITETGTDGFFLSHPYIRFQGHPAYIDGLTWTRIPNKGFNGLSSNDYLVFRRNTMSPHYSGGKGMNPGFIMTETGSAPADYTIYQDNTFHTFTWNGGSCARIYSVYKMLYENNHCYNGGNGPTEGLAIKGGYGRRLDRITIRNNRLHDIADRVLDGNNHNLSNSEYLFNLVYHAPSRAVVVNQDGLVTTPIYFYRNTFIGDVVVTHEAGHGPFLFTQNIIINDNGHNAIPFITPHDLSKSDDSRITMTNNLTGTLAAGVVSSEGILQGTYRNNYLGTRGHEITPMETDPNRPLGVQSQ
jgi:hypothetical protein